MKLEELVPDLELCKRIPDGEFEDSAFCWFHNGWFGGWQVDRRFIARSHTDNGELFPAPTLEEILKRLEISTLCGLEHHGDFFVSNRHIGCFEEKAGATAALRMWLKLKGIEA